MSWTLELVTAPTIEPVTLEEVRDQLRIDHDDEDAWLDAKMVEGRLRIERWASVALLTQTWRLKLSAWPACGVLYLPRPPLASVTSIAYIDANGASQTWSSTLYDVDTTGWPGKVAPKYGESFPSLRYQDAVYAVTVTYVAGYLHRGDERLTDARRTNLELVALWYGNREGHVDFATVHPVGDIEEGILRNLLNLRCLHDFYQTYGGYAE